MLKLVADEIAEPVKVIFNQVTQESEWPKELVHIRREWVPVYMKEDPQNVANYRPETLLRRQWITSLSNCSAVKLGISSKLSLTIRCQHIESVTVVKQL